MAPVKSVFEKPAPFTTAPVKSAPEKFEPSAFRFVIWIFFRIAFEKFVSNTATSSIFEFVKSAFDKSAPERIPWK